jgi:hypothetical protein
MARVMVMANMSIVTITKKQTKAVGWSAELQLSILKQLKLFYSKHTNFLTMGSNALRQLNFNCSF